MEEYGEKKQSVRETGDKAEVNPSSFCMLQAISRLTTSPTKSKSPGRICQVQPHCGLSQMVVKMGIG
jgi:hypothetical protein